MDYISAGNWKRNRLPIHPKTVHMPLAFLAASSFLHISSSLLTTFPGFFAPFIKQSLSTIPPEPHTLNYNLLFLSHYSNIAGIFTAIPAIFSGAWEANKVVNARGFNLGNPVVKKMVLHSALMDAVFVGSVVNWYIQGNVILSTVLLLVLGVSAGIGGELVYIHGVSVKGVRSGGGEKEDVKKDL